MSYLVCQKCGGYYELQGDESPEDFVSCHCGGQLIYVESLNSRPRVNPKKFYTAISVFILITVLAAAYMGYYMPEVSESAASGPSVLATDNRGTITKETFTSLNTSESSSAADKKTIAVITGMHPREKLSQKTVDDAINQYSLPANYEIIHYQVNVTSNPDNYVVGRSNGEGLVASYIISDIKKSNVDVVIICHDHAPGYGNGYYVATPKMDAPSVAMGELIEKNLPEFTYYRATVGAEHGSSTLTVSYPLANAGIRTLVYEMPEWASYSQAFQENKKLISNCFQGISS
ncbi:MAG: hypothetical protein KO316_06365 [Methanobacterium sp.]|nr:hypothetical protein [Methanobacterium sp.]